MATGKSGSFAVTTSNRYISGYVQWSETYDVAGNYSVITATLRLSRTNTGYTTEGQSSFTLTINGNSNTETGYKYISYNSNTLCVSHSVTVPHEADGKKSIVISAEGYIYTNDLSLQSAQIELTVIPRASTLSAPNGIIGSYIMLTVHRASEAFTHTIEWSAGGKSGSLTNVGASARWDITDYDICSGNTSGVLVPCNFTVYTYSGAELIGSSTASCTLTIPNDAGTRPDISVSDISVINSGNIASWGEAVKNISKLRIGITASSGKYGASITSRKIVSSDGQSAVGSTLEITPNISGEYKFTATVTDSRGFSYSAEKTINVYDYGAPVISSVDISRCISDGTVFDEGTYIKIAASYSCTSINGKNTIDSAVAYYIVSGSGNDYTTLGNIINGSVVLGSGQFDIGTSYDIKITVTDTVGKSDTYETAIGTAATEFNVGINKVGVGKYAEKEGYFEIGYLVDFENPQQARESLMITPDNIGAAPDGYGLGKNANTFSAEQKPTIADFTQTGWYRYAYNTSDNPYPGYGGIVQVVASDILLIQLAYPAALNYRKNSVSMRQKVDGSWQSWIELYSSGTVPVSSGGTGATSAENARENLGITQHKNCSNTDFNTIKTEGTYYGYTGMTNAKFPNKISVLEVIVYSPDWLVQRQTAIGSQGNQTWERHWYGANTWTEWKQIYTSNEMAWKKASIYFSSSNAAISATGVTTSSTIIATRGDSSGVGGGTYNGIGAADCSSAGTINLASQNTVNATWTVNLWWSK